MIVCGRVQTVVLKNSMEYTFSQSYSNACIKPADALVKYAESIFQREDKSMWRDGSRPGIGKIGTGTKDIRLKSLQPMSSSWAPGIALNPPDLEHLELRIFKGDHRKDPQMMISRFRL